MVRKRVSAGCLFRQITYPHRVWVRARTGEACRCRNDHCPCRSVGLCSARISGARPEFRSGLVDEGFPKSIASYWPGFKEAGFGSGIDAIVRWDNEWAYAFKGDKYIRFHIPTNKVDQAPKKTTDYWKALAEVGSQRVLSIF